MIRRKERPLKGPIVKKEKKKKAWPGAAKSKKQWLIRLSVSIKIIVKTAIIKFCLTQRITFVFFYWLFIWCFFGLQPYALTSSRQVTHWLMQSESALQMFTQRFIIKRVKGTICNTSPWGFLPTLCHLDKLSTLKCYPEWGNSQKSRKHRCGRNKQQMQTICCRVDLPEFHSTHSVVFKIHF